MKWDEIDHSVCSVARAMSVIGDRWTILILREAFIGTRRFDEFQLYLTAAPHIISMRLKKLVEYGLLGKQKYQDRPTRYEYRLTESGRELYPAIVMLAQWGYKWLGDDKGPAINRIHKSCGHRLTMVPSCAECGAVVNLHDVKAELSPRFAAERRRTVELHNAASESARKPGALKKLVGAGKRKS